MKNDLTYTIIHGQVGAEKYWEEIEGFISGDLQELSVKMPNKSTVEQYNNFTRDIEFTVTIRKMESKIYYLNPNHPLSDLANKLGAKVYGGFEDWKDFHLLLPTIEGLRVGDILHFKYTNGELMTHQSITGYGKHFVGVDEDNQGINRTKLYHGLYFLTKREPIHSLDIISRKRMITINDPNASIYIREFRHEHWNELFQFQNYKHDLTGKNIFQEYARTGIIENDLYKQFFK